MTNPHNPRRPTVPPDHAGPPDSSKKTRTTERVDDQAVPCKGCGYDLRGLAAGGRCPECGRTIPNPPRRIRESNLRAGPRDTFGGAWRSLAVPSLAPVLLLSPLPYQLPWGVVVAVCVGFAPAFRLLAMRRFDGLPEPFESDWKSSFAKLRRLQWIELAFAVASALFALIGTFGLLGKTWIPAYFSVVCLWWWIAIGVLRYQIKVGERVTEDLSDPSVLPKPMLRRARRLAFAGQAVALLGVGLMVAGMLADGDTDPQAILLPIGLGITFAAAAAGLYVALVARGQVQLVAECIHESPVLRLYDPIPTNPLIDEDDLGQPKPPPAATRFTPPGAAPDDDEPIPLA